MLRSRISRRVSNSYSAGMRPASSMSAAAAASPPPSGESSLLPGSVASSAASCSGSIQCGGVASECDARKLSPAAAGVPVQVLPPLGAPMALRFLPDPDRLRCMVQSLIEVADMRKKSATKLNPSAVFFSDCA